MIITGNLGFNIILIYTNKMQDYINHFNNDKSIINGLLQTFVNGNYVIVKYNTVYNEEMPILINELERYINKF